jgi:hypothetical protein
MNTKGKNYKEYLKLRNQLDKNWEAQRKLGYKPLEKPIPHGYDAYYVLREDISRRSDSSDFQYIFDNFSKTVWCRRKDFMVYSYNERRYIKLNPSIKNLTEREYEKLPVKLKKYFYSVDKQYWNTIRKEYVCTVPDYFFTVKIIKSYKTHYKVIDEVLKQEAAYLSDKLKEDYYNYWSYYGSVPKKYVKLCNRKDRRKSKMSISKAINSNEWDEMDLPGHHRHYARWEYY